MTQIVVISNCCFAQNDLEMYNVLKRKWWAIVLPIRSFFGGKFLLFCERICHQFPTKFCHGLPNLKTQSSCLGAGQIFVRREIWQICQLTGIDLKENTHQENLISIFSRSISIRSPPKLFLSYAAIKQWRWKIRTSECCITILTQDITITVPKLRSSCISRAKYCSICIGLSSRQRFLLEPWFLCPIDGMAMFGRSQNFSHVAIEAFVSCDWHVVYKYLLCLSASLLDISRI